MSKLSTEQKMPWEFDAIKDTEFHSQFHSVFIEEVPASKMPIEDEEGIVPDVYYDVAPYTVHRFYVGDFAEDGTGLHSILNKFEMSSPNDILEFHIDSNGGSVNEGKLFFNLINKFHEENVAAILNTGYSMGALLFCMPKTRIIHEFSDLMFHDYSTFMYGKAGDLDSNHVHSMKHMRNFFRTFTIDKGFLSSEEFELMLVGKEFWFDAEEMCKRGIATAVQVQGKVITAKEYLESLEELRNPKLPSEKPKRTPKAKKV